MQPISASLARLALFTAASCAGLGSPRPAAAADPPQFGSESRKATLLGIEGKGSKFVYVFDHSGSMGVPDNKPLNRAKAELLASVGALDEVQQFYIIFYNQDQKVLWISTSRSRSDTSSRSSLRVNSERDRWLAKSA
jgi:hypothetical protein